MWPRSPAREASTKQRLASQRLTPDTQEKCAALWRGLHTVRTTRESVAQSRGVLEQVSRESWLFAEAVELCYTFPMDSLSPVTGTGVVPAAGFEPAIFTLKG